MATAPLSGQQAANPLAGVAALLQTLGGTRQTQTSNPGDITALQQVFANGQKFDSNALLQTIFQQAGGQIPGYQRALGNAIGARSGNNSAVSAALQKLLMQTSLAGQQQVSNQILQNQQQQGNVAANIANATKGTTQTTKSGTDLGKVAKLLAAWQIAGQTGLIDGIGKTLGINTGGTGASTGTTTSATPQASAPAPVTVQSAAAPMATQSAQSSPVYGGTLPAGVPLGTTIDTGLLDQPGMGSMDWTGGATLADGFTSYSDMFADQANNLATMEGIDSMDALMGVTDGFGTIEGGGSNFIDNLVGTISGWLEFADGGLVGRDGQNTNDEEKVEDSVQRRFDAGNTVNVPLDLLRALMPQFADGGTVRGPRRNTTQQANPLTSTANNTTTGGTRATAPVTQRPATPGTGSGVPGMPQQQRPRRDEEFGIGEDGGGLSPGGTAGVSQGTATAIGIGIGLATGNPALGATVSGMLSPTATNNSVLGNMATTTIGAITGVPGIAVNAINNAINSATSSNDGFNSTAGISVGEPGVANAFGAISSPVDSPNIGPGISLGTLGSDDSYGGGAGAPGTGATGGEAGSDGSDGSAAAGVGVGASGEGEASDGLGFRSGGEVNGPGTGTSDSIIARLSDGEYVIPADVVDVIGVDFFDALRAAIHQPTAQARR